MDVFANKIRQLIGLAGFKGAGMERLTKLTFITEFPGTISVRLQQVLNIETLTMGDLIGRARVLTTTGDQSQDVAVTVCSPCSGGKPPFKSDSISSVTCNRCSGKGHTAKDCWKHGTHCYQCSEVGHWAQDCSGNETGPRRQCQPFH